VKYLLDTHALLWIVGNDQRLSDKVQALFLNTKNDFFLSVASLWEMAIKISLKKLEIGQDLEQFREEHIRGNDVQVINIRAEHIFPITDLPFHHRDPFDRLLVCQAMVEKMPIISKDPAFDAYPVKRIWQ